MVKVRLSKGTKTYGKKVGGTVYISGKKIEYAGYRDAKFDVEQLRKRKITVKKYLKTQL
jgi:hypothetical protein